MVLGTATQRRKFLTSKWFLDNNVLEQVEDYTYLGINIHCSGSYKQILRVLHSKALRVYHGLSKTFSNIEKTPVKTLTKLFSTIVLPISNLVPRVLLGTKVPWWIVVTWFCLFAQILGKKTIYYCIFPMFLGLKLTPLYKNVSILYCLPQN